MHQCYCKYQDSGGLIDENIRGDLWNIQVAQGRGVASKPKKLVTARIKGLVERAIWAQGLRDKLENGKKRHPFQAIHIFRKWFKTICERVVMRRITIEKF